MVFEYYNRLTKRYLRDVRISSTIDIIDKEKFSVGDNDWINHYTRIDASGGVKIGKGCIIGTNSVVTKDIPDFSVAVGSSAKIIKSTLEEDRAYFDDSKVREYYFNATEIQAYQSDGLV